MNKINAASVTTCFTIDFINKKIIGTKTSFNKAGKGHGDEYEELTAKMLAHPDFELLERAPKHPSHRAKRTYKGMDWDFMEAFIAAQKDSEAIRKEYDAAKKFAEDSKMSVYPMTKRWFLNKFASEDKPFDMAEAHKIIAAYNLKLIKSNAAA